MRRHPYALLIFALVLPFLLSVFACSCDKENANMEPVIDPIIAPLLTAKNLGPPLPARSPDGGLASFPRAVHRAPLAGDASVGDGGTLACGAPPLPDCPMRRWMNEHTVVPVLAPDFPELVEVFKTIATFAPPGPGYPYWKSISLDGASAAQDFDIEAVHAGCRGCHTQYREKYVAEMRPRPIAE